MIYSCCNDNRKGAVLGNPNSNGIDYLEVLDHDAIPLNSPRQQTLLVHCLNAVPASLTPANVLITGGESITGISVQWISPASTPPPQANALEQSYFAALADAANVLVIRTNKAGDFSTYTLRLVNNAQQAQEDSFAVTEVLAGFDPQLADVDFCFKVECGPDFDCAPTPPDCPPDLPTPPPINYLAKDYGSFRSIMLDRLNQLLPDWGATTEADLGVVLAEVIAYVGDYMSYQQDAVATEAYLETARSRISLRRHALLVDYHVHDGCNARTWMRLQVSSQVFVDHTKTRFYTQAPGMPKNLSVGSGNEEAALLAGVIVFEPMQDAELFPEHNQLSFYTWGDTNCCLPIGATEATLYGTLPNLQPGDVLIFQEMKGPQTGQAADADIRHRCAVRLTQVTTVNGQGQPLVDPLFEDVTGKPIVNPVTQKATPVTEIQWSADDALKFAVCLSSSYLDSKGEHQNLSDVSVAFGNVVLADQGLSFSSIDLGTVPAPNLFLPANANADHCQPTLPVPVPVRFRPLVPDAPITQAVPLPLAGSPVTAGLVMLNATGFVDLMDANGNVALMVRADQPFAWPQFFGVATQANAVHPANVDLSVVYNPPGGAKGMTGPVVLEKFNDLSFTTTDSNFVATQINLLSKLILVPSSYVPPAAPPAGFPAAPTMLSNSASVDLEDLSSDPYLTVQATNPAAWPQLFGVLAQGNQQNPSSFNLVVVYQPSSGGVGVNLPVTVEQFTNVSLATVAADFSSDSELITVKSFDETPNPSLSAYDLMHFDPGTALPVISLSGTFDGVASPWHADKDLLEEDESGQAFVVEVESDGTATLRFGDNINGKSPDTGTSFVANYRIGNGTPGNVGAETLINLAGDPRIQSCSNPLPATGGTDPETSEQIRRRAPQAFMTQQRAVTMADYDNVAEENPLVDQAVSTLRWTGSWYTVFIAAEPHGGGNLTQSLRKAIKKNVERYHLAGQDLEIESPQYVSIQIELQICVDPDYFRADVKEALEEVLSNRLLPNGQKGLFFPDNFGFGQTVYLSPVYAAARKVPGVQAVTASLFQPQGVNSPLYLQTGEIKIGSFQVARLENDRNFPDHGQLTLVMEGGK
jgi:hypothetical protein